MRFSRRNFLAVAGAAAAAAALTACGGSSASSTSTASSAAASTASSAAEDGENDRQGRMLTAIPARSMMRASTRLAGALFPATWAMTASTTSPRLTLLMRIVRP